MTAAARQSPGEAPVLSLRDAAFGYAERTVISGVTLDVVPGEVVALTGPNGSGKTTLVKGLLGLTEQHAGSLDLFGVPARQFRERTRLGYVPQRHTLATAVPSTVAEVVGIGRLARRHWWQRASPQDREHVHAALELVGLADRAREDVSRLSGGQQRRVLIARALAAEAEMLIMDEPTAGVDVASQQVLVDVLIRLARRGTTMLVVTHELEALAGLTTRVVCTRTGAVDFDGTPEEYAHRHDHPGEPRLTQHHHGDEPAPRASVGAGPTDRIRRSPHV